MGKEIEIQGHRREFAVHAPIRIVPDELDIQRCVFCDDLEAIWLIEDELGDEFPICYFDAIKLAEEL